MDPFPEEFSRKPPIESPKNQFYLNLQADNLYHKTSDWLLLVKDRYVHAIYLLF